MNKKKLNRILEIVIGSAFIVVLIYVVSVTVKVTTGVSRTLDTADHMIRLQVLNGCGEKGLAGRVADDLEGYQDGDIEIMVVDTDNFEVRQVPRSFLISREEDKTAATLLAKKLGIEDPVIVYRSLENNYRHVSVTLVLGLDHESLRLALKPDEEIQ